MNVKLVVSAILLMMAICCFRVSQGDFQELHPVGKLYPSKDGKQSFQFYQTPPLDLIFRHDATRKSSLFSFEMKQIFGHLSKEIRCKTSGYWLRSDFLWITSGSCNDESGSQIPSLTREKDNQNLTLTFSITCEDASVPSIQRVDIPSCVFIHL